MEAQVRGNKSFEEIADGFPTDLGMKMVVDADRVLNKGHSCCVCEDVAATALCLTHTRKHTVARMTFDFSNCRTYKSFRKNQL